MVNRLDLDTSLSLEEPDLAPMSPRTDCGSAECNETIQHHASELVKMRAERDQLPLDVGVLRSRVRQLLHSSKRSSTSTRGEYQEEGGGAPDGHKRNKVTKLPPREDLRKCLSAAAIAIPQVLDQLEEEFSNPNRFLFYGYQCAYWSCLFGYRAMVSQNLHQGPEGEREQPHEGEDDEEMGGGSSSSTDSKATPVMYQESGDSSSSSLSEEEQQQPEETPKKRRTDDHLQDLWEDPYGYLKWTLSLTRHRRHARKLCLSSVSKLGATGEFGAKNGNKHHLQQQLPQHNLKIT
ncbi:Hypothetical protein SMAX5B_002569 [Scophthalmus maximus]|uniref:Uncharacterized protein n=1 Tax=Scophthalmus maximus TaxID=52904 RepID=A0A2U9AWY1_SCOMX|nr:Hypothetical protein SMAX5B_002569 [Scophthalmus maximus]